MSKVIPLKTASKCFWRFRNQTEESADLLLYGLISSETWWGDEITPKQFAEDLKALGDVKRINVFINSDGGDVFAGQAIHSMLKRHPAEIIVYVDGLAASIASVIAMAGDRIIMPRNAMMMVHNPLAVLCGLFDAVDLRSMAEDLDVIRESIIVAYQDRTHLDRTEIISLMDAETWMTAEDAVAKGFADEIEQAKQVAAVTRGDRLVVNGVPMDLKRYRNVPWEMLSPRVYDGVVPENVSTETADKDAAWKHPTLSDFTDQSWNDLSDSEKRRIAGHFGWAPEMPPARFSDLKLPHHNSSDGKVNWTGLKHAAGDRGGNAENSLEQADIPEADKERVRKHLAAHYHDFGEKAPWERQTEDRRSCRDHRDHRILNAKRKWTKQEAEDWLKKHDFKTSDYEKLANYHSFRQNDPNKYDEFRTDTAPFGFNEEDGVIAIYGIFTEDGERKTEIQSIRFYHGEADSDNKQDRTFATSSIRNEGRTLSAANEKRIKQARDLLNEVLDQLESSGSEQTDSLLDLYIAQVQINKNRLRSDV